MLLMMDGHATTILNGNPFICIPFLIQMSGQRNLIKLQLYK